LSILKWELDEFRTAGLVPEGNLPGKTIRAIGFHRAHSDWPIVINSPSWGAIFGRKTFNRSICTTFSLKVLKVVSTTFYEAWCKVTRCHKHKDYNHLKSCNNQTKCEIVRMHWTQSHCIRMNKTSVLSRMALLSMFKQIHEKIWWNHLTHD
jgi:hypothetical protein